MVRIIFILLAVLAIPAANGQAKNPSDSSTRVADPSIRTLSIRNPDDFMSPPVIRMNSEDCLDFNFDIIGDSHEYLRYRLVSCNADWTPSRLLESEYVEGFNEAEVNDYAYSSNTFVRYVNYNIRIPNPDLTPLVSGNYLLQVFREDSPDDVILQARFSVAENLAGISANVTRQTDRGVNAEWQQVEFEVDLSGLTGINPYQDLIVTVEQNNRAQTMRTLTHPQRVEGSKAIFQHLPQLVFEAGNEYRRFETVRIDNPGMHADSVEFKDNIWHAYLAQDLPRAEREYSFDRTQHGRFKIDEYNASEPDLGADYVVVHFYLDIPYQPDCEIFVGGGFALDNIIEANKMRYDHSSRLYKAEIPLKQGSYNYQYLMAGKDGASDASPSPIEGNFHETANEYLIKVFSRPPGARYDRLISSVLVESD